MHLQDATRREILDTATKSDGNPVGKTAIDETIERMEREPTWRGADTGVGEGRGRPTLLDEEDREEIRDLVFDNQAKACVTTSFVQRKIKRLREVSRWCIGRALHAAGLAWLIRRDKRVVPKEHVKERMDYCEWIIERRQDFLNRFAYTDGTTFYLARTDAELVDKQRLALGKRCWRMATGKDGLQGGNVGASMYAKSQGSTDQPTDRLSAQSIQSMQYIWSIQSIQSI
jgi:transposase